MMCENNYCLSLKIDKDNFVVYMYYWYYNVYTWIQIGSWDQRGSEILNAPPTEIFLKHFFSDCCFLVSLLLQHLNVSIFAFYPVQDL